MVVINKVDKPNCRPEEVHDQVFDLFFNLDATEEQLDFLHSTDHLNKVGSIAL